MVCQMLGMDEVMCGSPASNGLPVALREPATTQLLEPAGCCARPRVVRTWAICSASAVPSPSHAYPGSVITGFPRG